MAFALPLEVPLATEGNKERVLGLFNAIARETFTNEDENIAYIWYRKADDNDREGNLVHGLEVYQREQSLVQDHRAGSAYKNMRAVGTSKKLFIRPSELIFYRPTRSNGSAGFLTRGETDVLLHDVTQLASYALFTKYYTSGMDVRDALLVQLQKLAKVCEEDEHVQSFYPMAKRDLSGKDGAAPIVVFERYDSKEAFEARSADVKKLSDEVRALAERTEVSAWSDGIGHIKGGKVMIS